jgi:cytochrome c-type biogenesis protein CcmH/NrfF
MMTVAPLAEFLGQEWLYWWQLPLLALLVAVIVFYVIYRRRQM